MVKSYDSEKALAFAGQFTDGVFYYNAGSMHVLACNFIQHDNLLKQAMLDLAIEKERVERLLILARSCGATPAQLNDAWTLAC